MFFLSLLNSDFSEFSLSFYSALHLNLAYEFILTFFEFRKREGKREFVCVYVCFKHFELFYHPHNYY